MAGKNAAGYYEVAIRSSNRTDSMSKDNDSLSKRSGDDSEEIELRDPSPVCVDVSLLDSGKAKALVGQVLQGVKLASDMIAEIASSPEATEYVLRIPKGIQEGLDSGTYKLMQKRTGELVGEVLQKSANSNRMVVKQKLEVVERTTSHVVDTGSLMTDLTSIAIQQQMAEISAQLDEMIDIAKRIEQGQQNDRFALIQAAEELLGLAAVTGDDNERRSLIRKAQARLVEGANKVSLAIGELIQSVESVPKSEAAITWKMLFTHGNYYEKMDEWFDRVQESFEMLEKAYGLLVLCAIATDEPDQINALLDGFASKIRGMDTRRLLSMGHLHPEVDFSGEWFADSKGYITARKEDALLIAGGEYIDVKLTGRMLMEAIEDETEEQS